MSIHIHLHRPVPRPARWATLAVLLLVTLTTFGTGMAVGQTSATPTDAANGNDPDYHFTEGDNRQSGISTLAVDQLPFSYTATFKYRLVSREFETTTGEVCVFAELYPDAGPAYDRTEYSVRLYQGSTTSSNQIGPTVTYWADGGYKYCWTSVPNNTALVFEMIKTNDGVYFDGSGRVDAG